MVFEGLSFKTLWHKSWWRETQVRINHC